MTFISEQSAAKFASLFGGRNDVYGTYVIGKTGDESYTTKHETVTPDLFRAHLSGGATLGIHPLLDDGTTPWLCIDLDTPDLAQAQRCLRLLQYKGVKGYIESSKRKGWHVWVFFKPHAPAFWVRQFAKQVLRLTETDSDKVDIFPAQDVLVKKSEMDRPVGNFVNLPYLGTAPAGKRVMLDDKLTEMTLDEFLAVVETNDPIPALMSLVPNPTAAEDGKLRVVTAFGGSAGPYRGPDPACFRSVLANPSYGGTGHGVGTRLAQYWLHFRKFDEDRVWDLLNEWNGKSDEPMSGSALRACMTGVTNDPSCTWLRKEPAFEDACIWQSCSFYKPERQQIDALQADMEVAQELLLDHKDDESEILMVKRLCQVGFVGAWVEWMRPSTDAPALFHALTALSAIAGAVGVSVRCRTFGRKDLHPNVWVALIAPSGIYHKSTAISAASRQLGRAAQLPEHLIPHDFTTEALNQHLAENPGGLLLIDELSGFLENAGKKFKVDVKMQLTKLYENEWHSVARSGGKGNVSISDTSVSVLSASTKHNLQKELAQDDFATGFLARFLFLPGNVKGDWVGLPGDEDDEGPADRERGEELAAALRRFSKYSDTISFNNVRERFNAWNKAYEAKVATSNVTDDHIGLVSRAGALVQRYAMLFQIGASAADRDDRSTWGEIEPWVLDLAIDFVEWAVARQMSLLKNEFAFTQSGRDIQRLLDFLRAHGGQAARSAVTRALSFKKRDFDELVETALDGEYIEVLDVKPSAKGGAPKQVLKLLGPRIVRMPKKAVVVSDTKESA